MGRTVTVPRPSSLAGRRRDTRRALVATGVLPTYDMLWGSPGGLFFAEQVKAAAFNEIDGESWPTEAGFIDAGEVLFRDGCCSVHRLKDGTLVNVHLGHGGVDVTAASSSRKSTLTALLAFRDLYPATYLVESTDDVVRVPITFWTNSPNGPSRRLRMIDSAAWEGIEENYPSEVHAELATLMDGFKPGESGQFLLWQGPPGTGKTWALRALASHWRSWAEFNYITDPDAFFVDAPIYMMDVLLSDSYEAIEEATGDLYATSDPEGKWRVLILEDTGELLSAKAKEKYGQGLSRLLNVVDGMIGQGLRVLCLVTTNDELGELNPAVLRPGRCASQIVFRQFTSDEATALTGTEWAQDGVSLAEIYAARGTATEALEEEQPEPLVASAFASDTTADDVAAVAEKWQGEATGYGEAAWNADTRTVLYVAGDWTDVEPIERDMLAIDGVDAFEYEYEAMPTGWCDAAVVYGADPWQAYCSGESALADTVALAHEPLPLDPNTLLASVLERTGGSTDDDTLLAAINALAESHKTTVEGVAALVASAAKSRGGGGGDALALAAIAALSQFAGRPAAVAAPPVVHVHTPRHDLNVHVDGSTVHVPEQPAPVVHFHEAERGDVIVNVPPSAPVEPAAIHVHVPEQAAPVVNVPAAHTHVDVHVPAPAPQAPRQPRSVRVEYDAQGNKRYVAEGEEE